MCDTLLAHKRQLAAAPNDKSLLKVFVDGSFRITYSNHGNPCFFYPLDFLYFRHHRHSWNTNYDRSVSRGYRLSGFLDLMFRFHYFCIFLLFFQIINMTHIFQMYPWWCWLVNYRTPVVDDKGFHIVFRQIHILVYHWNFHIAFHRHIQSVYHYVQDKWHHIGMKYHYIYFDL